MPSEVDFYTGELPADLRCPVCNTGEVFPIFWGGLRCYKCNYLFDPETKQKILCDCGSPVMADAMGLYGNKCEENSHDCSYRRVVADVELYGGPDCQLIDEYGAAMYSSIEKRYKPYVHGAQEEAARESRLKEEKEEKEAKKWHLGLDDIIDGNT